MNLAQLSRHSGKLCYKMLEVKEGDILSRSGPRQIVFSWSKLFSDVLLKEEIERAAGLFKEEAREEMKKRGIYEKWAIAYENGGDTSIDCLHSYSGTYEFYAIRKDALRKQVLPVQFAFDFYK